MKLVILLIVAAIIAIIVFLMNNNKGKRHTIMALLAAITFASCQAQTPQLYFSSRYSVDISTTDIQENKFYAVTVPETNKLEIHTQDQMMEYNIYNVEIKTGIESVYFTVYINDHEGYEFQYSNGYQIQMKTFVMHKPDRIYFGTYPEATIFKNSIK